MSKLSSGWKIEDGAITQVIVSQKFDKGVGEEAQILNLSQETKFSTIAYKSDDLKKVLEKQVSQGIPAGYELQKDGLETKTENAKITPQGTLILEIRIKASVVPKFNTEEITRNLVGKKPKAARDYLLALPEVFSASVFIQPSLPEFAKTMPHLASRIKIETSSQSKP